MSDRDRPKKKPFFLQRAMGRMLFWGQQGVSRNIHKAVRHYERGAVYWGDPVSMYDYAIVLLQVRVTSSPHCFQTEPLLHSFSHTNKLCVLFQYIHTSPLWSTPGLLPGSSNLFSTCPCYLILPFLALSPTTSSCHVPLISWLSHFFCILFITLRT